MAVAVIIFLGFEWTVRAWFPQNIRTQFTNGLSLGLKSIGGGFQYRPFAQAFQRGPEFQAEYRIDAEGLRDLTPHPTSKPQQKKRILLLGDSFTFGHGNHYDHIWPVVLEKKFEEWSLNVDVVKAGVQGYDTRTEAEYLERIFPRYLPDIVVLGFLVNDLFTNLPIDSEPPPAALPLHSSKGDSSTSKRSDPSTRINQKHKKSFLHSVTLAKRWLLKSDYLYSRLYLLTPRRRYFMSPPTPELLNQIETTKALLIRIRNYCDKNNARLIVLSIPQQFQLYVKSRDYNFDRIDVQYVDEIFSKFASQQHFLWVISLDALSDQYKTSRKNLYYRLDGHLNSLGNAVLGSHFGEYLRNHL